jgi:hypothetical protein
LEDFARLLEVPLQVVFGDNIPTTMVPELPADERRGQLLASRLFAKAVNDRGGDAEILQLPDVGLRGNSHFMFSDLNNEAVADQLALFLRRKGVDGYPE